MKYPGMSSERGGWKAVLGGGSVLCDGGSGGGGGCAALGGGGLFYVLPRLKGLGRSCVLSRVRSAL